MPAYNEETNIENVVRKCAKALKEFGIRGEVVVTNDGSTDKTGVILAGLKKDIPNLVVIEHEKNAGYGAALSNAIKAASGDLIATIDSDGQFDIEELPLLLAEYNRGYRVVAGYRKKKMDSFLKVFANKVLSFFTNCLFGLKLKDANSAFKLYEAALLKSLKIESRGFQTPTEIMVKLKDQGVQIREVGITHAFREKGKSALGTFRTTYAMIMFFLYLKLKIYLCNKKFINEI